MVVYNYQQDMWKGLWITWQLLLHRFKKTCVVADCTIFRQVRTGKYCSPHRLDIHEKLLRTWIGGNLPEAAVSSRRRENGYGREKNRPYPFPLFFLLLSLVAGTVVRSVVATDAETVGQVSPAS